ncbi:biotin--protein ligase-like isoform X2 [Limulus polyphemus]|nr:biotin--protein ligase-like isoform X2 [Limulus polyphemus]XP_022243676.1 biotin--protein ligase-like isoform X2 [Limulus polyphemus]XP_022243677.1 biotin--protein ligase-like isoform X2 [Limulus polyphemus]XP_022243678.1 biotin--protein ligase-like isoform X2 [Limulus polyphemus]
MEHITGSIHAKTNEEPSLSQPVNKADTGCQGKFLNGEGHQNKPPNILVYTGEDGTSTCVKFNSIKENLLLCLLPDQYVIYLLKPQELTSSPWQDNAVLLVISSSNVPLEISETLNSFISKGGKIVNFCTELKLSILDIKIVATSEKTHLSCMNYQGSVVKLMKKSLRLDMSDCSLTSCMLLFQCDSDRKSMIYKLQNPTTKGFMILSQVHLELDALLLSSGEEEFKQLKQYNKERLEILQLLLSSYLDMLCGPGSQRSLTSGILLATSHEKLQEFLLSIKKFPQGKIPCSGFTLHFVDSLPDYWTPALLADKIPVCCKINDNTAELSFNLERYRSYLQTKVLGQIIIYFDVVSTTMTLLERFTNINGIVAISKYQTKGRGRGENEWLGPEGCAMFTLHVSFPLKSQLGQNMSFIQHLATLAIVQAVCDCPGYEDINLKIKWPNDIYYGSNIKVGGVLVNSSLSEGIVSCFIGCGVNIKNSNPTTCINDIIQFHSQANDSQLEQLTVEKFIAQTLTRLEDLISCFQIYGSSRILPLYYSYWLHSGQEVWLEESQEKATIQGLDEHGFLRVKTSLGNVSFQPDGNSFDMMQNLIRHKKLP